MGGLTNQLLETRTGKASIESVKHVVAVSATCLTQPFKTSNIKTIFPCFHDLPSYSLKFRFATALLGNFYSVSCTYDWSEKKHTALLSWKCDPSPQCSEYRNGLATCPNIGPIRFYQVLSHVSYWLSWRGQLQSQIGPLWAVNCSNWESRAHLGSFPCLALVTHFCTTKSGDMRSEQAWQAKLDPS